VKERRRWRMLGMALTIKAGDNRLNSSSSASHLICLGENLITPNSLLISFAYFAAIK
jgi:hypothetical protein